MSTACPHCGGSLPANSPEPDDSALELTQLRLYCVQAGIRILPVGMVRERDAAALMGLAEKTLKNRRSLDDPKLPSFEIRAGRALYSLASLAAWMTKA